MKRKQKKKFPMKDVGWVAGNLNTGEMFSGGNLDRLAKSFTFGEELSNMTVKELKRRLDGIVSMIDDYMNEAEEIEKEIKTRKLKDTL